MDDYLGHWARTTHGALRPEPSHHHGLPYIPAGVHADPDRDARLHNGVCDHNTGRGKL